jgi:membrane-bound serine protease (ClpP class)
MDYFLIFMLLAAGLFLLLTEIFIPSYGLLSVGALGSLFAGLFLAFRLDVVLGFVCLALVLVLLPIEIVIGVKYFPHTWIGHRIVIKARARTTRDERSSDESLFELAGREGATVTACRPAGVADIGGRRVDVVAEGTMIDANRPVKIMRVEGNRVVIRERDA